MQSTPILPGRARDVADHIQGVDARLLHEAHPPGERGKHRTEQRRERAPLRLHLA